jgi:hypothetical protein
LLELFHRIADEGSARVRRYVVDRELESQVDFRNLTYPEAEADFVARGGTVAPAVWDGERLYQGAEAAIARLARELDLGRTT